MVFFWGKMFSGIYSWISPSGGRYIGSAINLDRRKKDHIRLLDRSKHQNRALQSAFMKYGKLWFEILLVCAPIDLLRCEQYFIDNLKPRYNVCRIAGNILGIKRSQKTIRKMKKSMQRHLPRLIKILQFPENRRKCLAALTSAETRLKMSHSAKERWSDPLAIKRHITKMIEVTSRPDVRRKNSIAMKRYMENPAARELLSLARKGKLLSDDTKRKMSISRTGKIMSSETRAKIAKAMRSYRASVLA